MLIKVKDTYIRTEDILFVSEIKEYSDGYAYTFDISVGNYGAEKTIACTYSVNNVFEKRHNINGFHPMSFGSRDVTNPLRQEYLNTVEEMKLEAKEYIENLHKEVLNKWSNPV